MSMAMEISTFIWCRTSIIRKAETGRMAGGGQSIAIGGWIWEVLACRSQ